MWLNSSDRSLNTKSPLFLSKAYDVMPLNEHCCRKRNCSSLVDFFFPAVENDDIQSNSKAKIGKCLFINFNILNGII